MGNYESEAGSVTSKPAVAGNQVQAPKPKGDANGKPSIGQAGAAPAPKIYEMPNPTYIDAKSYAEKYFRRQGETASLMHDAATTGFTRFKENSNEEFAQKDIAAQLFELAIATSSGAGTVVLGFMKVMQAGAKFAELSKRISEAAESMKAAAEGTAAVHEAVEKGKAIPEAKESKDKAEERANFVIEASNTLLEMALEDVKKRWEKEDDVDALLQAVEHAPPTANLMEVVLRALPDMPNGANVAEAADQTKTHFEYLMYYQYYAESGKAVNVVYETEDEAAQTEGPKSGAHPGGDIENVPQRVLERIRAFGKFDEFRQAVAVFNTQHRRTLVHEAKPY